MLFLCSSSLIFHMWQSDFSEPVASGYSTSILQNRTVSGKSTMKLNGSVLSTIYAEKRSV